MKIINRVIVCQDNDMNAFPSVVKTKEGRLIVAFRKARDIRAISNFHQEPITAHIDPAAYDVVVFSDDEGMTWSQPRIMYNDYLFGGQDPSLNVLSDGSLLSFFFQWRVGENAAIPVFGETTYYALSGCYPAWLEGSYCVKSMDQGLSWSKPIRLCGNAIPSTISIRGTLLELDGGLIVVAVNEFFNNKDRPRKAILVESSDGGINWKFRSIIAEDEELRFGEVQLFKTSENMMIAVMRTHPIDSDSEKYPPAFISIARSTDYGKTWEHWEKTCIETACPCFPIGLRDKKVFLSYGWRKQPYSIRGRIVDEECRSIERSEEFVIADELKGFDIGYTWAATLSPERIFLVYYDINADMQRYIVGVTLDMGG